MSYVKLDRKMLNWGWKDEPNMVAIWIEILLQANYKDEVWHGEQYPKGTFPTSLAKLSVNTGLSIQQIRGCLARLERTGEISIKSTNKLTRITVNKWEEYQCLEDNDNKQITNEQQTNNNQITTLKEYKNKKNKKNNSIRQFTPPTLDEIENYCRERNNGVDAKKFFEYYSVANWKDSKGNPIKNWKQKMMAVWEKDKPKVEEKKVLDTW
ncbi:MAG: phage replisome organizer N-terminal domain-containing protein [Bacteroidales bacterium]|nr:phage replisome organizer N-terminal domain-containing protein [Candidatus Scybalousia scybalohippi]